MSNGDHVNQVAALALKSKSSVDFTGAASNPLSTLGIRAGSGAAP
jgi:hypothetical protein